jgi:hypothetical protein
MAYQELVKSFNSNLVLIWLLYYFNILYVFINNNLEVYSIILLNTTVLLMINKEPY